MIPPFDEDGLLPPGDYEVSFEDLMGSPLVGGPDDPERFPSWDSPWRARLVGNLEVLVKAAMAGRNL